MSLLKSNSVQIGQSTTGTNNFTLSVPSSPDGTIKLARGNSGSTTADILSVSSAGAITGATINGGAITLGTAVAATSGTAFDFTGIPSWVKRITVTFNSLSLDGTDHFLVQIGSGSIASSGYSSVFSYLVSDSNASSTSSTSGFGIWGGLAAQVSGGAMQIFLHNSSSFIYTSSHCAIDTGGANTKTGAGSVTLSGIADRLRVTRTGTNSFDGSGGSINIMYEG